MDLWSVKQPCPPASTWGPGLKSASNKDITQMLVFKELI